MGPTGDVERLGYGVGTRPAVSDECPKRRCNYLYGLTMGCNGGGCGVKIGVGNGVVAICTALGVEFGVKTTLQGVCRDAFQGV